MSGPGRTMPGPPARRPAAMHPNWRATRHDPSGEGLPCPTMPLNSRSGGCGSSSARAWRSCSAPCSISAPRSITPSRPCRPRCGRPPARFSTPGEEIQRGQAVWQSTGGMQQGSIWGHGGYVAPDWSADWLHREAIALRGHAGATRRLRGAGRTRSGADRRHAQARDAHQRLRSAHRRRSPSATSGRRHRGDGGAFRGPVHQPHARRPASARALRDAAERGADRGRSARADRLLLLDVLGGRRRAARRGDQLHQQLAARAAGRQHADRGDLPVDLHLHLRAARPASAAWSGIMRASSTSGGATSSRSRASRRPTCSAAPRSRRRCARPPNTSSSSPPCSSPRCCSASSPPIMRSRARASTACRWPNISPMRSPGPGTPSSRCCGSPPPGWRPASTSPRCSAAGNRNSSASA